MDTLRVSANKLNHFVLIFTLSLSRYHLFNNLGIVNKTRDTSFTSFATDNKVNTENKYVGFLKICKTNHTTYKAV